MHQQTIAVIAFDDISPFQLSVPCMVFGEDRRHPDGPRFRVLVCAVEEGALRTNAGFEITTEHTLADLAKADIVIVPSWRDPEEIPAEPLLAALDAAHRRGALVVGLCLGTYVLAAAGLLDGRPATTHWGWLEDLALRFPRIAVQNDLLYVDDGDVITSAGVAAGIDCCLHILRRCHGAEAAGRTARRMVVAPHRQGGQAQFIERPIAKGRSEASSERFAPEDRFAQNLEWVLQHLDRPHSIDSLAERCLMSRRTFTRRFRQVNGTTVGAWLQGQRLLETTAKPIDLIAQESGFPSVVSLRAQFNTALKTTPSRYRREFRGNGG